MPTTHPPLSTRLPFLGSDPGSDPWDERGVDLAANGVGAAMVAPLSGGRLHLQHGPIDLIVKAHGNDTQVRHAYRRAAQRFHSILAELVAELPLLRRETGATPPRGTVARRMWVATRALKHDSVTPMAAVAGAVADEVLAIIETCSGIEKAYVNNGGDIALLLRKGLKRGLTPAQSMRVGLLPDLSNSRYHASIPVIADISAENSPRGVATSGWRGRSHSLGIADAVTVLSANAAEADALATVIANAVNVDSTAVDRVAAVELDPDSDLGDQPVTVAVAKLNQDEREVALAAGVVRASLYKAEGVVHAAYLYLQGSARII